MMDFQEQKEIREAQALLVKPEGLDLGEPKVLEAKQEELVALECRASQVMTVDLALLEWLDHQANRVLWDSVALREQRVPQGKTVRQENGEQEETRGTVATGASRVRRVPQAERGVEVKEVKLVFKESWD